MFPILVETEDVSYFTDQLEKLTGKPRSYWAHVPLKVLKRIYIKEIQRKRGEYS